MGGIDADATSGLIFLRVQPRIQILRGLGGPNHLHSQVYSQGYNRFGIDIHGCFPNVMESTMHSRERVSSRFVSI